MTTSTTETYDRDLSELEKRLARFLPDKERDLDNYHAVDAQNDTINNEWFDGITLDQWEVAVIQRLTRFADNGNDFRAWEARMGLARVSDVAAQLGVSRQTASELRNGRCGLSPPIRRLMFVLERCRERGLHIPPEQSQ